MCRILDKMGNPVVSPMDGIVLRTKDEEGLLKGWHVFRTLQHAVVFRNETAPTSAELVPH